MSSITVRKQYDGWERAWNGGRLFALTELEKKIEERIETHHTSAGLHTFGSLTEKERIKIKEDEYFLSLIRSMKGE